jgi:diaminohydroxyphosphoribosylaminopyrimidine deaminase / 5-amino-6-(5-phosphoribosylamino)uracil reductase
MTDPNEKYMDIALREAAKGAGNVSPNPLVGAVLVKNGQIIGKGYHRFYGEAHAEVNAVRSCAESPAESDLYVTLEPCSHFGKTPPCTDLIIREKIKRVFIGTVDPSPHATGKGIEILRNAGIEVNTGICEDKCRMINAPFFHYLEHGTPLIILKAAASLDGYLATECGDSKWITNEKSRRYSHKLRNLYDAVLVGKNTVLKDDPELTVRKIRGRNPVRIVTDRDLSLPADRKIFNGSSKTIIITSEKAGKVNETFYKNRGISLVRVAENNGFLDLEKALKSLVKKESDPLWQKAEVPYIIIC